MTTIAILLTSLSLSIPIFTLTEKGHERNNGILRFKFQQHEWIVKHERAVISFRNRSILSSADAAVIYFNRSTRALYYSMTPLHDHSTIRFGIRSYKFLSNEYRFFPMTFEFDFCAAIKEDVFDTGSFCNCGNMCTDCNYKKNVSYYVRNWSPDVRKFPPYIPFGRYKIDSVLMTAKGEEALIISWYGEIVRTHI